MSTAEPTPYELMLAAAAILERTRTTGPSSGGRGGDTGPADVTVFNNNSRPTAAEVEELIDQAVPAVIGQIPGVLPAMAWPTAQHACALYAAILVETSFFRESLDEGSVELYRELLAALIPSLQGLADGTPGAERRTVDSVRITGVHDDPLYGFPLAALPPVVVP
jgi:hypothetical protein